jgi:ZIP family zinc transporter
LGGILVLKLKKHYNSILGFAGGVMLSVVLFEVFPEIVDLHQEFGLPLELGLGSILFGLLFFHTLAFLFPLHEHGHHEHETHSHTNSLHHHNHLKISLGIYGAVIMIVHAFIDGFGIGLGFGVSQAVGISVAIAVIMHNFSDGINTVSTLLHSNTENLKLKIIFFLNILAPLAGVLASKIISLNPFFIYIYLGIFSGSILYLAISDILPQAHADRKKILPIFGTFLGVIFVILLTRFLAA